MSHYPSYYKSDAPANYSNNTFIITLLSLALLLILPHRLFMLTRRQ